MLKKIFVQNYILIDNLTIAFDNNFSVLTGETGSGKSILLGALGLVLGNRADVTSIKTGEQKCIVEAYFDIANYDLKPCFEKYEIDYDDLTILRREITSNGKSRAFINDTPVNLNIIKELGEQLVDIHSQHQTLNIVNREFQLSIVDTVAKNQNLLKEYQKEWEQLQENRKKIEILQAKNLEFKDKFEFISYQYNQLKSAKLTQGEIEELEIEQKQLNNSELIIGNLSASVSLIKSDDTGILSGLKNLENYLNEISDFLPMAADWCSRAESVRIDIQEIVREIENRVTSFEFDPQRLSFLNERVGVIYELLHKHNKQTVDELLELLNKVELELSGFESFDQQLEELKNKEREQLQKVQSIAKEISKTRLEVFPTIESNVTQILQQLGMPLVQFGVENKIVEPNINGIDQIRLLFSSNKQVAPDEIYKIASGGELSRLMLALKSIMSESKKLPTIIFDEIDIGVSGETADKMANIMSHMSQNMQVISITHLPQVAAKAHKHYLVYKDIDKEVSTSKIRMLTDEEQVIEIARMLSGEQLGKAAIENARELLSNKIVNPTK